MGKTIPINTLPTHLTEATITTAAGATTTAVLRQERGVPFTFRTFIAFSDDLCDKIRSDNMTHEQRKIFEYLTRRLEFGIVWVVIRSYIDLGRNAPTDGTIFDKARVCRAVRWLHKHQYIRLVAGSRSIAVNPHLCFRGYGIDQNQAVIEWDRNTPQRKATK